MQSISRRGFLRVAGAGLLAAPLLAACGGAAPAEPAKPAAPAAAPAAPAAAPAAPAAAPAAPAAAASPAAAPTVVPPATKADAAFDWKQFKGETLYIPFSKHPWATVAEAALPEFTELTGINVNFEDLPEIQARQKLVVEFAGGGGNVDAFFTSLHVEKTQFSKSGWYLPLNDLLKDKKLVSPELDLTDTVDAAKAAFTLPDGQIIALPVFTDVSIMAYRKDLLDAKGIKPPTDHTELEAAIKAVHNPPQVYGWCARGLKNANMTQFPCQFFNFGGKYLDASGKATLNGPGGAEALDWYTRMDREYAPPGVVNFNWYEVTAAFMQGQVAFMEDGINFFVQFEDETKSKVKGQVGYMLVPKGPGGLIPPTYTTAIAVSAKTKKPGPAFLLAQYLTGKTMGIREQIAGVGVARLSTWDDPKVKEGQKMPKAWIDTFIAGMKSGKPGLPEIAQVTQYRDEVGALVQKTIEGGNPKDVINEMNTTFQAILDKEPK
jgi:multiple sugar transport system substrate-binding protein